MKFGEKVRKLRKESGMTQSELAEELKITLRTVQNYERGGIHPKSREIYYRLASVFDVDSNYFLTEDEEIVRDAYDRGGSKSAAEVEELIDGICGLFAGGTMPEEDMDAAMKAIADAYFSVKDENKKYTPKKYIKQLNVE